MLTLSLADGDSSIAGMSVSDVLSLLSVALTIVMANNAVIRIVKNKNVFLLFNILISYFS